MVRDGVNSNRYYYVTEDDLICWIQWSANPEEAGTKLGSPSIDALALKLARGELDFEFGKIEAAFRHRMLG